MKKLLLLFQLLIVNYQLSIAQNPLVKQWDKRFGGTNWDWLSSFQQTLDGGYMLAGSSTSLINGDKTDFNWGYFDYWVVKIDSLGNKQWDKDFGGTDTDELSSIQQTIDGGYILAGYSSSNNGGVKTQDSWGSSDYWILKIDSLGNKQWDNDFGGTSSDVPYSIQQTNDGGYILGGYSFSNVSGNKTQPSWGASDYWIVKTDSLGNKQWDKDFGGIISDLLYSVQQTSDGGYILGGQSNSIISGDKTQPSQGGVDYWIVKTDSLGNKQWDKDFGGSDYDLLYSLQQTTDGGFVLAGVSYSGVSGDKTEPLRGGSGDTDWWIVKIDSLGIKEWDRDFGGVYGEDGFNSILQTSDKGYLLAGTSYSNISGDKTENNLGNEQTWIIKTDSLGIKQWDKTLQTIPSSDDEIGLAIQTKDGCFAFANYTDAGVGGYKTQPAWNISWDYWIIKFCDTTLTTSISPNLFLPEGEGIAIAPNPFTNEISITFQKQNLTQATFTIKNILGQTVFKQPATLNFKPQTLNLSFLSKGIYLLELKSDGERTVKKIVKE